MIVQANAKINLGLKILNRLPNGYHTLYSFFLEIDLHDRISVTPIPEDKVEFHSSGISIPGPGPNLCETAAKLLKDRYQILNGVKIHLKKKIPVAAGLGGGSSDAAAVLKALNNGWQLDLPETELMKLAAELGADVPFFIRGGFQLAENTGNKLTIRSGMFLSDYFILLVNPGVKISTRWAYRQINKYLKLPQKTVKFAPLETPLNWQFFENDFERVIDSTYPEVGRIKQQMLKSDAIYASLSGSGPTVYSFFDNSKKADAAEALFASHPYWTVISRPVIIHKK